MMIVALGVTTEGVKVPLGLWEGDTENATVVKALLSDLVDRGLDPAQGMLFVIDGSKALRKAIRKVFGERVPVQRCVRHKECHEDGHVRGGVQPRGRSLPRGVPSCSIRTLGSIGQRAAPGGARSRAPACCSTKVGRLPTRTGCRCSSDLSGQTRRCVSR